MTDVDVIERWKTVTDDFDDQYAEYHEVLSTGDALARELESCRERLADLDNALRTYVDWHQSCADHHVDDCPEGGNCKACRIDRLVNLALTAPASDEAGE